MPIADIADSINFTANYWTLLMCWGALLQPDLVLGKTVVSLSPQMISKHRLEGLILDVDDTLISTRTREVSPEVMDWFSQVRPLLKHVWLVSNNISDARIRAVAQTLSVPYIISAAKPSRRKLRRAWEAMELDARQVAMVGDRLFTDVLAGYRLGLFTVLVKPMFAPGQTVGRYPVHAFEVWFSEMMGASLEADS